MYENLIIWQYQGKPKAFNTMKLLTDTFQTEIDTLLNFSYILDIESAEGKNLDLVGKHLGVSRRVNNYTYRKFFGFFNFPNSLGFSVQGRGGGRWYRYRSPISDSVFLDDDDYRWLIKSKVLRNNQQGTLSDIYRACLVLFGKNCSVKDNLNMTTTVSIPKKYLKDFSEWAIKSQQIEVLPRQCGTKINYEVAE